ncbi:MAG TPA: N-terminal phage integrase SAM-like domain-containing protein, partial [Acidimicrobiia bacterium]|nr:N-terminal phage integrase SAM-like domain-containing protein [Acidimicrobiia bacterium]
MGSIQRIDRPKPWLARYRGPDGRQHSKTFRRKVDAEKWLRGEESAADRAEWVDPRGGSVLFTEWAETWLAGLHELKPKTFDGYSWHLSARVLPAFADKRLQAITPAMVREWQNRLLGDGLSPGTVRQSRQV